MIALATTRIEELSAPRRLDRGSHAALQAKRPTGSRPDETAAMLDMRDALATADTTELTEIFGAHDVSVTYTKPNAGLELAATVTQELVTDQKESTAPEGRSQNSVIAGARYVGRGDNLRLLEICQAAV